MPLSALAVAPSATKNVRVQTALENAGLKFHIRAGKSKWECTVLDRATHERTKAARADSAKSLPSASSSDTK